MLSALCALLLAAGCAVRGAPAADPTSSPPPEPLPFAAAASSTIEPMAVRLPGPPADELVFAGRLLICSDLPYPPQEFFDAEGNPVGSDVELGQEIAHRLGLDADIVNTPFDTIIDAVNGGKCDVVISAQSITAERQVRVDMVPYFQAGMTFVVQRGNPASIRTELALCGRRIAAQGGTLEVQVLESRGEYEGMGLAALCVDHDKAAPRVREYDKDDEALAAIKAGHVDAYFVDSPVAGHHVVQNQDSLELSGLTLDVAVQGISVPKDKSRLRRAVEAALRSMMDDGTYIEILGRYGVQDGSVARGSLP